MKRKRDEYFYFSPVKRAVFWVFLLRGNDVASANEKTMGNKEIGRKWKGKGRRGANESTVCISYEESGNEKSNEAILSFLFVHFLTWYKVPLPSMPLSKETSLWLLCTCTYGKIEKDIVTDIWD
ncbi:hypothetical protein WN48_02965 [Eufriesea mexicana]|uniref:Uncharacterized protein n=1 Tax=Eufriesea mexicana TaxID=516756 RepID=A0A310S4K9_9HYME|nr:hypothetical protein WN48_02965 [Eufriesea mexicana]